MKKPSQVGQLWVGVALAIGLSACSFSKKADSDTAPELVSEPVAQTDPAPLDAAETPTAPASEAPTKTEPQAQAKAEAVKAEAPKAEAAPAPQVAQAAEPAQVAVATTGAFSDYPVQATDTLMKIAFDTYGDVYQWKKIFEANKDRLKDPNVIPAGTVLRLDRPATSFTLERHGERYVIRMGDTLGTISSSVYGTPSKWRKLWDNNRQMIRDPNRIFAGFTLYYVPEPKEQEQPLLNSTPPLAKAAPVPSAQEPQRAPASAAGPSLESLLAPAPAPSPSPTPAAGN